MSSALALGWEAEDFSDIVLLTEAHAMVARLPGQARPTRVQQMGVWRGPGRQAAVNQAKRGKVRQPEEGVRGTVAEGQCGCRTMEAGQRKSEGQTFQGLAGLSRSWVFTWE